MTGTHYDLVIIGGGPGGLTAGIYAARARMNVALLERSAPGGQILISDNLENYPGFPGGLSGPDLVDRITAQAKDFGLPVLTEDVLSVDFSGDVKKLTLSDSVITATSVIIATGANPRKLGVPGEDMLMGKGVSFCATCDGPFFRDKIVAAVGGGDTAVQESIFLTKFAKKVYLIHRRDELRATKILQERALANEKIEMVWDSVVTNIEGLFGVEKVNVKNVKDNSEKPLAVEGCFIWVGITPNSDFLKDSLECDKGGFIKADAKMETSVPGVFAIGDVRTTPLRQVATAVGDGAIAAVSAEHYIENIKAS